MKGQAMCKKYGFEKKRFKKYMDVQDFFTFSVCESQDMEKKFDFIFTSQILLP